MATFALPNVVSPSKPVVASPSILLHGISWETYEKLREEIDNAGQHLSMTYDRGSLEIMPPLHIHEDWKNIIGGLIEDMCLELRIEFVPAGSTTFRRKDLEIGLEPDESYYVQHALEVRRRKDLNLDNNPPPDLVVEVDWTNPSIKRERIYAEMGVPEIWRMDETGLTFLSLKLDKQYVKIDRSIAFPFLAPSDLERFVLMPESIGSLQTRLAFRQWVQTVGKQ